MKKIFCLVFLGLLFSNTLLAQSSQIAIDRLQKHTQAVIRINNQSGVPEFIKFPVNKPLTLSGGTVEEKVQSFFETNPGLFEVKQSSENFSFEPVQEDANGLASVTIKQQFFGVPIYDGQLRFHFNNKQELTAINGNYIPGIKINPNPTISVLQAHEAAFTVVNNQDINYSGKPVYAFETTLYVFQKGLAESNLSGQFLAYEVEVRNDVDVREYVFVNAHDGSVVQQFTGMPHALDRVVYEGNVSNPVWEEGDDLPGDLTIWQQNEVIASAHVYNFFNNTFGYVSYDNADATMRTINNNPNISCPNANWNGVTANYCNGTATDDVIAHEWGHAYTEYTSELIYFWQSGAINESYSDIWGETVDLINNYQDDDEDVSLRTGCSSSDRWRIGEDATAFGGAIRDMWMPTCNGDPGKLTDGQYRCGDGDFGGVHSNSGIPNHAYALLVDGGTYNGQTITGIGITKAAHIFWRTQSTYLTATSDFYDLADGLEASCLDLLGVNLEGLTTEDLAAGPSNEQITMDDYNQLVKALLAVEIRVVPEFCGYESVFADAADPCEAATNHAIFYEDWETGFGNWSFEQVPVNPSVWDDRDWIVSNSLPQGRLGQAAYATATDIGDCVNSLQNGIIRLESPSVLLPLDYQDGDFEMTFMHYFATEEGWDGANIKYQLNDTGDWLVLPAEAFTDNPYNKEINSFSAGNDNPMAGEDGFSGADGGSNSGSWGRSTVNLSSISEIVPGTRIKFRFEMGTDGCNGRIGWYIDDIAVYNCNYALSVDDFTELETSINVYPNPSNGYFTLVNNTNLNLNKADVMDINGRIIKSVDLTNAQQKTGIDISHVASGLYFVKVYSGAASTVIKLIKD
ncbi:M4 family metallopeptidase [Bizionia sp. KMM 8389]